MIQDLLAEVLLVLSFQESAGPVMADEEVGRSDDCVLLPSRLCRAKRSAVDGDHQRGRNGGRRKLPRTKRSRARVGHREAYKIS